MPPFRLEGTAHYPTHSRKPQIIYTKNQYTEGVKFEGWQELLQHRPIDVDPYCPGKVNNFLSHYNRLGTQNDKNFQTTTQEMLQQVFIKDKMVPNKLMYNYYTYNNNAECLINYPQKEWPFDPFLTTMQHSFKLPKPYVMQRLAFPRIPFMQNRKYHHDPPQLSPNKFHDEKFEFDTCQLQKHKSFRWTSYNPMTGTYTNTNVTTK